MTKNKQTKHFNIIIEEDTLRGRKSELDVKSLDMILDNISPLTPLYYPKGLFKEKPRLNVSFSRLKKYISISTDDDRLEGLIIKIPLNAKEITVSPYRLDFKYYNWSYHIDLQLDQCGE